MQKSVIIRWGEIWFIFVYLIFSLEFYKPLGKYWKPLWTDPKTHPGITALRTSWWAMKPASSDPCWRWPTPWRTASSRTGKTCATSGITPLARRKWASTPGTARLCWQNPRWTPPRTVRGCWRWDLWIRRGRCRASLLLLFGVWFRERGNG